MILLPRSIRIDLPGLSLGWLRVIFVFGVVTCNFSSLQASIVRPESPEFHLDAMSLADTGGQTPSNETPNEDERNTSSSRLIGADAAPSSSSSGSSALACCRGGSTLSAVDEVSGCMLFVAQLTGWVTNAARIALPLPPGADVMRPPQVS